MRLTLFALCLGCLINCKTSYDKIRILTAGIAHESNSFNPWPTLENDFQALRGEAILKNQEWAEYLMNEGVEIIPVLHSHAGPYGTVDGPVYEKFRDEILGGIRKAGKIDGIYLEMHGALNVRGYDDAQLDFIRAIREITGNDMLIAGSFDLHGNISADFAGELNMLTAYRTAPHVDGQATRLRAVKMLLKAIREDLQPVIAHINIPVLIPGEKGITSVEPLSALYSRLPSLGTKEGLLDASIFAGMPWTDVPRAGMSVQVVAQDRSFQEKARQEANALAKEIWDQRQNLKFDVPVSNIDDAIKDATDATESTVFITDSGDNTTAGAAGDNTFVLSKLMSYEVADAVVAGITDPEAVKACEKAGVGKEIDLTIGGKIDTVFGQALKINGKVHAIFSPSGPDNRRGSQVVVKLNGITLVLISDVMSFTSPQDFENVGIDPLKHKIVVVKLGYLFQELRDIAPRTIMALTPGFANQVIENLPYRNVRRPIYPLDPDMTWAP
ncbi:MAG TPA: M81 family metallopeptidase [Cyclobacteriaceae bacterium]|nr:M81 family metallopeptidase [Cyclobacteriaceae bacterium]